MDFIKKIREKLGLNFYKMSKKMGMKTVQEYISFENNQHSVNIKKLLKLWELSGLSAKAFMELIKEESLEKTNNRQDTNK